MKVGERIYDMKASSKSWTEYWRVGGMWYWRNEGGPIDKNTHRNKIRHGRIQGSFNENRVISFDWSRGWVEKYIWALVQPDEGP